MDIKNYLSSGILGNIFHHTFLTLDFLVIFGSKKFNYFLRLWFSLINFSIYIFLDNSIVSILFIVKVYSVIFFNNSDNVLLLFFFIFIYLFSLLIRLKGVGTLIKSYSVSKIYLYVVLILVCPISFCMILIGVLFLWCYVANERLKLWVVIFGFTFEIDTSFLIKNYMPLLEI